MNVTKHKPTLPRFLPMRTEILLSLRSLSSFLCFSFSESFALSLPLFVSPFSLSECKLLRELEPFSNDGRPKLRTDDFLWVDPGVVGEVIWGSFVGEELLGGRRWEECVDE